jgi:putative ABC transport system ATP-binding protein
MSRSPEATNVEAMIEVENLTKTYMLGEVEVNALCGVSINIRKGEWVAIMGPSGSGKSTLMNILGCLDQPTSGTYRLDGIDVSRMKDGDLAGVRNSKIGFIFQTFNLLPRTSAVANVELPLIYAGASDMRPRALAALERVGLKDRVNHRPNELSGGQQQRVAIARALVTNPTIILADEPTGNLDSKSGAEIISILHDLHETHGMTIVMVTHDAEVAAESDRTIHIRDGQVYGEERNRRPTVA